MNAKTACSKRSFRLYPFIFFKMSKAVNTSTNKEQQSGGPKFATDDPRLRDIIIKCKDLEECISYVEKNKGDLIRVVIIGFPFDEGCARNGGREGSKEAPGVFRFHLYKIVNSMGGYLFFFFAKKFLCFPSSPPTKNVIAREATRLSKEVKKSKKGCLHKKKKKKMIGKKVQIFDAGDIDTKLDYDEAHNSLSVTVFKALSNGFIPFVIGGSNDQSYFNALALINVLKKASTEDKSKSSSWGIGVMNIDAHFDVRPQKAGLEHSGSPFRLLLENKDFVDNKGIFSEFAAQGHQCSMEHYDYIKKHNNGANEHAILWLTQVLRQRETLEKIAIREQFVEELKRMRGGKNINTLFISFDIDSIRSSDCPGVSCPSPIGLTSEEAMSICLEAGKCSNVRLMDCSEFNPKAESYLTGRLVSTMFYHFVLGLAQRK
ncbi:hypothetical protein RFI_08294 [Reticulomyxa filosa]|uniref:Arginase n=1 Tax=Reticulomyxa filosa TaxID=46433 RepID=X6NU90_RETFI|nr:hypothetical protein RFI_08294 [Reticulomyxa filosa]|eukprot:ETO28832.1 hypothetical protein RFI_08294 [Reticulomyxa filosa]